MKSRSVIRREAIQRGEPQPEFGYPRTPGEMAALAMPSMFSAMERIQAQIGIGAAEPIATVVVPVRTVSELNSHEHWRYRQKRAKEHRTMVTLLLELEARSNINRGFPPAPLPLHIHLTRLAPGKLDSDNLAGSQKHVRDAVAKFLGVDDGDESKATWSYDQERSKTYAVRICFYRRA